MDHPYNYRQFLVTVQVTGENKYAVDIVDDTDSDTYSLAYYDPDETPSTMISDGGVDPHDLAIVHDAFVRIFQSI